MEARRPERVALPLAQRWYAPLALPVQGAVEASLAQLERLEPGAQPWWTPRAGLASAWVASLVQTFGTRKGRSLVRAGAVLGELANLRQFTGAPDATTQRRWARQQGASVRRLVQAVLVREQDAAASVLAVWRATPLTAPQPESVLWLRALTGWAVVAGRITAEEHALLDVVAARMGAVVEARLDGGPRREADEGLRTALAALPDSALVERLESCLETPGVLSGARQVAAWTPRRPPVCPLGTPAALAEGEALESALSAVIAEGIYADTGVWLLQRGGKRVRPALALAAAEACGGEAQAALPAAALVEWLHQASLLLDDVMDGATLRRGAPTLHVATSEADALATCAWLLERVQAAAGTLPAAIQDTLRDGARQLALGQLEEVARTGETTLSLADYHRILAGKTASLFGVAARVGALSVEATPRQVRAVEEVARCAGLAFQLMDDLLDYIGEPSAFGKASGVDLRARKVTLPVMRLRAVLPADERARLDGLIALGTASEADVAWVRERLLAHGVDVHVRERAHAHLARSEAALTRLPGDTTRLRELILRCVERRR